MAISSSVILLVVSASAVVSDIPPGGCDDGWLTYGVGGSARVDGPASAFLCSSRRARDVPYGWNLLTDNSSVLVGRALCGWNACTSSCVKVSEELCSGHCAPELPTWETLVESPLWLAPE